MRAARPNPLVNIRVTLSTLSVIGSRIFPKQGFFADLKKIVYQAGMQLYRVGGGGGEGG